MNKIWIVNFFYAFLINLPQSFQEPFLYLYKKNKPDHFNILFYDNNIGYEHLNHSLDFIFIIHGFKTSINKTTWQDMKNNLLKREDSNVIMVDWSRKASGFYFVNTVKKSKQIGQNVAEFIRLAKINPLRTYCVGHSLGAHICGFIGKEIKLKRITGLDPAGPLFRSVSSWDRLDKDDAYLVDVIHTSSKLGLLESIGHKDFYPNGGSNQPGCSFFSSLIKILGLSHYFKCSHKRAKELYTESILTSCKFRSVPCDSYDNFKLGKCECSLINGCDSMGYRANFTSQQGKFYLDTYNGKDEPFCID